MPYRDRLFWRKEEERVRKLVEGLKEEEREPYLKGYQETMRFWFDLEKRGLIDIYIGKHSGLLDGLADTD